MKNLNMTLSLSATKFTIYRIVWYRVFTNCQSHTNLRLIKNQHDTWLQDQYTNEDTAQTANNNNNKASIEPSAGRDIVSGTRCIFLRIFLLSCHTNCFTRYIHAPKTGTQEGQRAQNNPKQTKRTTATDTEWKAKAFCFHFWDVIIMNIIGAYMHMHTHTPAYYAMNKRTDKQDESPKQRETASNLKPIVNEAAAAAAAAAQSLAKNEAEKLNWAANIGHNASALCRGKLRKWTNRWGSGMRRWLKRLQQEREWEVLLKAIVVCRCESSPRSLACKHQ